MKMKKTLIASAVLAGMSGAINPAAADVYGNANGTGDKLVLPYYTTRGGQSTIINIVNTSDSAKALKVSFRDAQGSEDVLDFHLFLSPDDVWVADLANYTTDYQGNEYNVGYLKTVDKSCISYTKRYSANGGIYGKARSELGDGTYYLLSPNRIPNGSQGYFGTKDSITAEQAAWERTREGYITIIEMASFKDGDAIYEDVLHDHATPDYLWNSGTPPCLFAANALDQTKNLLDEAVLPNDTVGYDSEDRAYRAPTGGVYATALIIDVPAASALMTEATPFVNYGYETGPRFFPQDTRRAANHLATIHNADPTQVHANWDELYENTLDQKIINDGSGNQAQALWSRTNHSADKARNHDLPDLSQPFELVGGLDKPWDQVNAIESVIYHQQAFNDFYTVAGLDGSTDHVFTLPTKRYRVMGRDQIEYGDFKALFDEIDGKACEPVYIRMHDREEFDPWTNPIQPSPGLTIELDFCGEANVIAFNMSDPENNLNQNDIDPTFNGVLQTRALEALNSVDYAEAVTDNHIQGHTLIGSTGWARYDLTYDEAFQWDADEDKLRYGLPVIGFAALRASVPNSDYNFGAAADHKYNGLNPIYGQRQLIKHGN
jgi:hypothetical protein